MRTVSSLRAHSVPTVVLTYLLACEAFNLLCARGMSLGAFSIRTADLLSLIQLPGLLISGSVFTLAVLRYRRLRLWDVVAVLTIVASVLGIVVVIFSVFTPLPDSVHSLREERLRSWPRYHRRAVGDFSYSTDYFAAFAFTALDTWFCLGWFLLLRLVQGKFRER